jgi:pyridoxal biosynthesis lyase PdxS
MTEHVIETATLVKIGGDQIFSAGGAFDSADPSAAAGAISRLFPIS